MADHYKKISLIIMLGLTTCAAAMANESADDEWHFSVAPYVWAQNIRGNLGHPAVGTHSIKSKFSDIIKDVDLAFMAMGEARKGPYSVLFDVMYIHSKIKKDLPASIPADQFRAKGKVATGFLGAGYTVYRSDALRLDAVAGLRGWHADVHLGLHGGYLGGASADVSKTWLDAKAGLRGRYKINDQFSITTWGLAGGGQAKSDWDVAALLNWSINQDLTFTAGYRAMGVNYRKNGFIYDIKQKGPMIGLSFRF